jgi:hypothetical protein
LKDLGDDRAFKGFGLQSGIESQVRGQVGDLHPCQTVNRSQGNQRNQSEECDDTNGEADKGGKRASTTRMGTHRSPDAR